MPDASGVSSGNGPRGPHGLGTEWFSFELRMRRRRFATCLQQAEQAIDAGNAGDARAAIDEALGLFPDSPEAAALERRLESLRDGPAPATIGTGLTTQASPRTRKWRWAAYAAVGLLVCTSGAALSAGYWYWTASQTPPAAAVAAPPAALPGAARADAAAPGRLTIVHETVRVTQAAPRIVEELPQLRAAPGPPVAQAQPEPEAEPSPVMRAVNRTPSNPPPPETPEVRSEVQTGALPAQALAEPPVMAPPPSDPVPAAPPARSEAPSEVPDASRRESVEPDSAPPDESVVLTVLRRYEHAYSRLDADAASAVWPKVNRGALARAFDGLASQRVFLGSCDVAVDGAAARATCSGTSSWEPKIGGGLRTEARRWNFELKKSGGAWRIERAVAH